MGRGSMTVYLNLDSGGLRRGVTQASSALRRFDREGQRSIRGVDRATDRLGRSMRSAARYAVGAAAAYVSIDQARVAVETTFELNRATKSLAGNFGLSTKMASGFAAVAKARNVDVTSLTMAFKTLSTQVMSAKEGTGEAADMFNRLGISARDLKGMNMDQTILAVTDAFGKMNASGDKGAIMSKLMGRGFSRLSFLFRDGKEGLMDYLDSADKFGASMDDLTSDQLARAQRAMVDLKLAQFGLYQSFTVALSPAIEFAAKKLGDFALILNNPRLSTAEKFSRIGEDIQRSFEKVDWNQVGNFLAKGIETILPLLAEITGKVTPALTAGFVRATPAIIAGLAKGLWSSKGALLSLLANMGSAGASEFGRAVGRVIGSGFKAMFGGVTAGFKTIASGARAAGRIVGSAFRAAGNVVKAAGNGMKSALSTAFRAVGSAARSVANAIRSALTSAFNRVKAGVNSLKSVAVGAFNAILSVVQSVASAISGLISKIASIPSIPNPFGRQRGGPIYGMGSGDKIPAMLEPGEFVLNREAVKAYGMDTLYAMNYAVPRFATGGIVQRLKKGGKASKKNRPKPPKPKPIPKDELGRLEADLAGAELTYDTTADDKSALIGLINYWKRIAGGPPMKKIQYGKPIWNKKKKRWEYKEKKVIDYDKLTQARNAQNSYQQQLQSIMEAEAPEPVDTGGDTGDTGTSSGSTDTSEADSNLAELNTQLQIMVSNQRSLLNVSQSQYGVLVQALAAAVSGHIGGKIGLGSQAPAVAGRLASY